MHAITAAINAACATAAEHYARKKDAPGQRDLLSGEERRSTKTQGKLRWITLKGEDGSGGAHVQVDDNNNIVNGPKGLADKGIKNLNDFGKKDKPKAKPKTPKDEPDREAKTPPSTDAKQPDTSQASVLTRDALFERDKWQFGNIQKAMGFKTVVLGRQGVDRINRWLSKHPGGDVIRALLGVDGSQTQYDQNGFAERGNDAYRKVIESGKFSSQQLQSAAEWLSSAFGRGGELSHVNQNRWIYGEVELAAKAAAKRATEAKQPAGSLHDQLADQLSDGQNRTYNDLRKGFEGKAIAGPLEELAKEGRISIARSRTGDHSYWMTDEQQEKHGEASGDTDDAADASDESVESGVRESDAGDVAAGDDSLRTAAQVKSELPAMTEEEYLSQHGASRQSFGEAALHRQPRSTQKERDKRAQAQGKKDADLEQQRDELRSEYREKIANGELREPTRTERLERAAQGHPDNESTQAARRVLEKRRAAREAAGASADNDGEMPETARNAGVKNWQDAKKKGLTSLIKEADTTVLEAIRPVGSYLNNPYGVAKMIAERWIRQTGIEGNRERAARSVARQMRALSQTPDGDPLDLSVREQFARAADAFEQHILASREPYSRITAALNAACEPERYAAKFDESKHPRASDGRFGNKAGEHSSVETPAAKADAGGMNGKDALTPYLSGLSKKQRQRLRNRWKKAGSPTDNLEAWVDDAKSANAEVQEQQSERALANSGLQLVEGASDRSEQVSSVLSVRMGQPASSARSEAKYYRKGNVTVRVADHDPGYARSIASLYVQVHGVKRGDERSTLNGNRLDIFDDHGVELLRQWVEQNVPRDATSFPDGHGSPEKPPKKPVVAGQQMGLFDEEPSGQKTLFNVVKPSGKKKTDKPAAQLSLLERITDDINQRAAESKPISGQRDLFSRSGSVERYELAPTRRKPNQQTEPQRTVPKRQPGDGTPGWQRVGGAPVFVDGNGKIKKGCPGLKGEHVADIIDESDDSRDVREARQAHAKAEGLDGKEYTAKHRRQHSTQKAQQAHRNAKAAAKQHGVSTTDVLQHMPAAHAMTAGHDAQWEQAKQRARQITGLTAGRIAAIENSYRDHSTVDGFDANAREFAAESGLFDPDDADTPARVWEFIREGAAGGLSAHSEDVAQAAAEQVARYKNLTDAINQQVDDSLDEWGDEDEWGDASFDPSQFSRIMGEDTASVFAEAINSQIALAIENAA